MDLNSLPYQPHSHGSSGDVIVRESLVRRLFPEQSPAHQQEIAFQHIPDKASLAKTVVF